MAPHRSIKNYSHMLAMLQDLPQAHHNRIEWLSKQPSIQPRATQKTSTHRCIQPMNICTQKSKESLEGRRRVSEIYWQGYCLHFDRNTPYMLVQRRHVWYNKALPMIFERDLKNRMQTSQTLVTTLSV